MMDTTVRINISPYITRRCRPLKKRSTVAFRSAVNYVEPPTSRRSAHV